VFCSFQSILRWQKVTCSHYIATPYRYLRLSLSYCDLARASGLSSTKMAYKIPTEHEAPTCSPGGEKWIALGMGMTGEKLVGGRGFRGMHPAPEPQNRCR
jgi:hypothetical protein